MQAQAITDFDQLYPGRFLKAGDLGGKDFTLIIGSVTLEELGGEGEAKQKAIVHFSNAKKAFVMNRTNGACLKAMFGRDIREWIGKRITLYPATIKDPFTGEDTLALRVRGSPDIDGPIVFEAKIGRKNVKMKLAKTLSAKGKLAAAPAAPPPAPEPQQEDVEGDPPQDVDGEDAPF
jgi:hypothetical protein